jgi:hypothetical protein
MWIVSRVHFRQCTILLILCAHFFGNSQSIHDDDQKNILRDDFGLGSFMTNVVPGIENPCIWRKLLHSSITRVRRSPYKYDAT